jgi:hypothetical protein
MSRIDQNADWTARGWFYLIASAALAVMAVSWQSAHGIVGVVFRTVWGLGAVGFAVLTYYAWRKRRHPRTPRIRQPTEPQEP